AGQSGPRPWLPGTRGEPGDLVVVPHVALNLTVFDPRPLGAVWSGRLEIECFPAAAAFRFERGAGFHAAIGGVPYYLGPVSPEMFELFTLVAPPPRPRAGGRPEALPASSHVYGPAARGLP